MTSIRIFRARKKYRKIRARRGLCAKTIFQILFLSSLSFVSNCADDIVADVYRIRTLFHRTSRAPFAVFLPPFRFLYKLVPRFSAINMLRAFPGVGEFLFVCSCWQTWKRRVFHGRGNERRKWRTTPGEGRGERKRSGTKVGRERAKRRRGGEDSWFDERKRGRFFF